jgi:hypothetical protein
MKIVSSCLVHVDNSTLADTRITHLRTLPRFLFLYRSSTVARVVEEGKTQLGFSASRAPLNCEKIKNSHDSCAFALAKRSQVHGSFFPAQRKCKTYNRNNELGFASL